MPLNKINPVLEAEVQQLHEEGRAKMPERIINGYEAPTGNKGPRYRIQGYDLSFIRMNSNSYLDLAQHPAMIAAADKATHAFGVGPGAVRFIDGTFSYHVELEQNIAAFSGYEAAKIFNSAYTSNLALALTISSPTTFWVGDELNHNSIIRAMRISNVPSGNRSIFKHNDMDDLRRCMEAIPAGMKRVCVIFDGIFSMRGDNAPVDAIHAIVADYHDRFEEGVITIVDDSHGIAAYGDTGRGTAEHTHTQADIIIGTFGKAFGVNGGFIGGSAALIEAVRQKADTYIYTNPLSVADCAAASEAIRIVDSEEGRQRLRHLKARTTQFRQGLERLGYESILGPHPVVPIVVRDTEKTHRLVKHFFEHGILVVGLTFPVVPKGSETIRVQINAGLTEADIDYALAVLEQF
ncbi:MAG: aminotransferase class I/II-fold pyridoxal phosphate-dependent enzyme [Saprospiraceae bacterium]